MITAQNLVDYLYNKCLPQVYVEEDRKVDNQLYRYLQALLLGGADLTVSEINGLLKLVDPENCPEEYFPVLYNSFGLEYYPDVGVEYHRKFLSNYGELKRRRGTYSGVRFLARVLTGLDVDLSYLRGEYQDQYGRHLIINLKAKSITEMLNLDNSIDIVKKFIGLFVPYYITVQIRGTIEMQYLSHTRYTAQAMSVSNHYRVRPRVVVEAITVKVPRVNVFSTKTQYKLGGE